MVVEKNKYCCNLICLLKTNDRLVKRKWKNVVYTQKIRFINPVKLDQIWFVYAIFQLIWYQTEFCLMIGSRIIFSDRKFSALYDGNFVNLYLLGKKSYSSFFSNFPFKKKIKKKVPPN